MTQKRRDTTQDAFVPISNNASTSLDLITTELIKYLEQLCLKHSIQFDDPQIQRLRRAIKNTKPKQKTKLTLPETKCVNCGNLFQPKRPWQRYCSKTCRGQAHLKTKKKVGHSN